MNPPFLSNLFEPRIGPLGTLLSRVYYTIKVDNSNTNALLDPPQSPAIQTGLANLGSDIRVLPLGIDSTAKSQLSNLFIEVNPLMPSYRPVLESNINSAIRNTNVFSANSTINVFVLYSELYQGQTFLKLNSRVYYAVNKLFFFYF